ncbi:MAG: protein-glutamate O-methyltransferase CheR [Clostridiales Family XIII bacterium]|jgi:chemotaxis protein methyltransferase CheR|nr:protein-glutamate O-methyltransferase CheR [Clostridiales Family XIII bacterium]
MITLSDEEFDEISNFIYTHYGVNLKKKRSLIEARLGFHIFASGYKSYKEYLNAVRSNPSKRAHEELVSRLTTNHTFFMREKDHFTFYTETVLPWIENVLQERDLRVWSAGCASGEEPYTLSLCTFAYLGTKVQNWDTTILASDISARALTIAKEGVYPTANLSALPESWIKKYFQPISDGKYKVSNVLRKSVAFRKINLMDPFVFKRPLQTIFCKNVMIYFDDAIRTELLRKFYEVLRPGGYLFVGHSESLSTLKHDFEYIAPSIYRKG